MDKYPNITEDKNPATRTVVVASIVAKSLTLNTAAPTTAGTLKRKLYRAAYSLFNPRHKPDAIVAPDLEIPGNTASP